MHMSILQETMCCILKVEVVSSCLQLNMFCNARLLPELSQERGEEPSESWVSLPETSKMWLDIGISYTTVLFKMHHPIPNRTLTNANLLHFPSLVLSLA